MKKLLLIILIFCSAQSNAQSAADTTKLQEIRLSDNQKKLKKKTFKFGIKEKDRLNTTFFYDEEKFQTPIFPISIPYGYLEEVTLYFANIPGDPKKWNKNEDFEPHKTELELNFYQKGPSNEIYRLNQNPIKIHVRANNKWEQKEKIDLSPYNLEGDNFFVEIRNVTDYNCGNCEYRIPYFYKTENKVAYHRMKKSADGKVVEISTEPTYDYSLKMKLKILTKEY